MKKWEYLIITVFTHKSIVYFPDGSTHEYLDSVVALNTLGDEGWELVNDTQGSSHQQDKHEAYEEMINHLYTFSNCQFDVAFGIRPR